MASLPDYYIGNIDINNRKVLRNNDNSISTESSMSFSPGGKQEVLIPTIINGKRVTKDQAISHYFMSGKHLGEFDLTAVKREGVDSYAKKLHERQGKFYAGK